MNENNDIPEYYNELLYDEEEEMRKIVSKVKKIVNVRKRDGAIIFIAKKDKLTHPELIGTYLLGKYFAHLLKLQETSEASIEEIAEALKIKKTIVSARLTDLSDDDIAERTDRGVYKILFAHIDPFLEEVLKKIEGS